MNFKITMVPLILVVIIGLSHCNRTPSSHLAMIDMLRTLKEKNNDARNAFAPYARLSFIDSLLKNPGSSPSQIKYCTYIKGNTLLELGRESEAIQIFQDLGKTDNQFRMDVMWQALSIAWLRQGERANCISNHAAESCILPIKGFGTHQDTTGSSRAIKIYQNLLKVNSSDLESRWLLNLAYMTLGEYPDGVPKQFLIEGMDDNENPFGLKPFQDIAADVKLNTVGTCGGSIVDDFNNDGLLDIVTSSWDLSENIHYFENTGNGSFMECTKRSNLEGITGGLNIMQTDYNNDGYKDIFVLRGAWKNQFGNEPNSLLRNNHDGTFTDVTTISGLLSFHPTQTATWNDFNNDGWLDVFIGNESAKEKHPCELYINNHDETFTNIAKEARCNIIGYVKGVASGDYDHDGWKDLCLSTMDGVRVLLRNKGGTGKQISFEETTKQAGLDKVYSRSFPTWFWDYDNDGWLDIFACDYSFEKSLSYYAAAEKLNISTGNTSKALLYHNNHDGTFTNVAGEVGLNKVIFAMGANFGDIDNDGYLDMYLGTGNPSYQSLVPNKMFKNIEGRMFADVTGAARVGHLQKGHGVSFADLDNDGDQDIYIDIGGAYVGDSYQNSLFLNQNEGTNNWICIELEGKQANRVAIGTSIKLTFKENGVSRMLYRDVNSGGSFGASPLRREIGIGSATSIDELEIHWHGSGHVQVFKNIKPNQFLKVIEGENELTRLDKAPIKWSLPNKLCTDNPGIVTGNILYRLYGRRML